MGVAAADVEDDGVGRARHDAAHLDVGDAVVDADERLAPELGREEGRVRIGCGGRGGEGWGLGGGGGGLVWVGAGRAAVSRETIDRMWWCRR